MGFWKNFWEMLGPDTNGESGSGENKYKYIADEKTAKALEESDERIGKIENRVLARPDTFRVAMKAQKTRRQLAVNKNQYETIKEDENGKEMVD
jgi:hypothetical protein